MGWLWILLWALSFSLGCDEAKKADEDDTEQSDDDDGAEKKDDDDGDDDDDDGAQNEPTKTDSGGGRTFEPSKMAVGQKVRTEKLNESRLKLKVAGKKLDMKEDKRVEKEEELLAVKDGAATKIRVTYAKSFKDKTKNGKVSAGPEPIDGKTYVVEKVGDEVLVTDGKGGTVPAAEETLVAKDYKSLGKPDPFLVGMPKRPLKKGERVPELELALQTYFVTRAVEDAKEGSDNELTVSDVEVTYEGDKGKLGQFDVKLKMTFRKDWMVMEVPFDGDLAIRLSNAWPAWMTLKGDVTIAAKKGTTGPLAGATGDGKMSFEYRYTYP
jgi:hypothetical protein